MRATSIAELYGAKFVREGDRIIASVDSGKPFEPDTISVWKKICSNGGVVVDVGAYTGLFSILASMRGCKVHAFEPWTENRKRFRLNALLNNVDCRANEEAVSDRVGKVQLMVNSRVRDLTSGASLVKEEGTPYWVKTTTLDSLCLRECAAIKIDVERAEPLVIAGALDTLRRLKPVLIAEVLGDDEKTRLRASLPDCYTVIKEMDSRNWLLEAE